MDPKQVFAKALDQAAMCIKQVTPDDLSKPTPCSEWNLEQLLNHMVYELLWVPDLLAGKTVAEVGSAHDGDVLHGDAQTAWKHAADGALVAVKHANPETLVHLSYADVTAKAYIAEIGGDILVHGWDVSRSLKCSLVFDPDVAQAVYDNTLPRADEFAASGLFGTPIDVPGDSSIEVKLLALVGRRADIEP